jgi:uncharacterized protein (TIGR03000 family)
MGLAMAGAYAPVTVVNTASANTATVVIKAPMDVRISVDGQATARNAAEETFTTPSLEAGRTYQYVFKAEAMRDGKTVSTTKRVLVQAGRLAEADFSDLATDKAAADVARVTVRVPEDAKVFVDGVLCQLDKATSSFETPKLEGGRQYFYTIKAEVVRDNQTLRASRRVIVEAGKQATVEFNDLGVTQAARR